MSAAIIVGGIALAIAVVFAVGVVACASLVDEAYVRNKPMLKGRK